MNTKKCTKCNQELSINEYYIKDKNTGRLYSWCKKCHYKSCKETRDPNKQKQYEQEYYKNNKEEILKKQKKRYSGKNKITKLKTQRKWRRNNKEFANRLNREYKKSLREQFLDMYGRKCACCEETIIEFLTIEHIEGQKGIEKSKKESGPKAYRTAIQEYRPDLYETLCWNCNCAKGHYGYCPHEKL